MTSRDPVPEHRIYKTAFSKVYPMYVQKAEKKGRTQNEVDEVICWLTGYSPMELQQHLKNESDCETFCMKASEFNPRSSLIKGVVCGVRVEDVEDPRMRRLRYLDKLIDELAKGKTMEKILRQE